MYEGVGDQRPSSLWKEKDVLSLCGLSAVYSRKWPFDCRWIVLPNLVRTESQTDRTFFISTKGGRFTLRSFPREHIPSQVNGSGKIHSSGGCSGGPAGGLLAIS